MNRRIFLVGILTKILLLASFLACGPTEKDRKRQALAAHLQKTKSQFSSTVARYNASLDWDKQVRGRLFAFSIDIQQALAAQEERPVVVFGHLRDIYSKGAKAYTVAEYDSPLSEVLLVLETSEDLLRSITSLKNPKYAHFAFVILPNGSSSPLLEALSEPESEKVFIDTAEVVVIRGHLLDFVRIDGFRAEQLVP